MSLAKYSARDVAKDFNMQSKAIVKIINEHAKETISPTKILDDRELTILFEYLTQQNQVSSIESIYSEVYQKPKEKTPEDLSAKEPKQKKAEQNSAAPGKKENSAAGQETKASSGAKKEKKGQPTQGRIPEKKVVDTRKGGSRVNLEKYNPDLEDLAPEKANRMQTGKQKIQNRNPRSKQQGYGNKRKQEESEKMRKLQLEIVKKTPVTVKIPEEIGVGELASRMKKSGTEVVKCLIKNGIMASLSDIIDYDTAALVAMELGCKVEREVIVTIEEQLIDDSADKEEDLVSRAPVVVVMGHVDHGKTSLLDYIRQTNVASGEFGGITQHIGAYQVEVNGKSITFLDTPGHEAFTAMRARGAMITDVAILVVAADDGIMPQTVESISHAKAANIPIIVAINKMDKPDANPERIKQQLTEYELVPEEWGGDTIVCQISAKTGMGIDELLDMVILTAEMRELKANPNRSAHGVVIEAKLDKGRGPVSTLLVQNGTLKQGDIIIAGTAVGHVRAMTDFRGNKVKEAGPSVPVEITGMSEVPGAGDSFHVVADERMARELVSQRKEEMKSATTGSSKQKVSLEDLFNQIQAGEMKELNVIVKADVQGSAEAVKSSLEKLSNEEVRVRVIHSAVGAISENDVMLAATSGAIIVGFNVRPDRNASDSAVRNNVDMRMYRVIYDCINEIEAAIKGMLAPKFREVSLGMAEVRQVYKITGVGTVAGCYVTEGKMARNAQIRLVRDGIVMHEGVLSSLQRFKDSVKDVSQGFECGIGIEKYSDIKEGDIIEAFQMEQIEA